VNRSSATTTRKVAVDVEHKLSFSEAC